VINAVTLLTGVFKKWYFCSEGSRTFRVVNPFAQMQTIMVLVPSSRFWKARK
jgi:hypothetical protein